MDNVSILISLFMLPGTSEMKPMTVALGPKGAISDLRVGDGDAVREGYIATFHYDLMSKSGRLIASSVQRGLPYMVAMDGTSLQNPMLTALRGMRKGGVRQLVTNADAVRLSKDGLVPRGSEITLRLRLVDVRAPYFAKVH